MDITIYKTVKQVGISDVQIKKIATLVLKKFKFTNSAVSIHCIGRYKMRRLNKTYRGKDYATDVLSFAPQDKPKNGDDLGDIFLCIPVLRVQARQWGVTYKEETFRMIIHGILHLLGYDHDTKAKEKVMFGHQEAILKKLI